MPTPVVMPQMGESIVEGTVVRWIKKQGEHVDRDEPLFEISTDKVDAEVPSPAAGVLLDIKVHEGETVPVDSIVATIGEPGEVSPAPPADETSPSPPADEAPTSANGRPAATKQAKAPARESGRKGSASPDAGRKVKSSPLVRRIAREHEIDVSRIHGTGLAGRVTKHDILGVLENGPDAPAPDAQARAAFAPGEDVRVEPMPVIRRKIAEHMIMSRRTSAHVHTVFHVNFSHVEKLRQQHKASYEAQGARLTFMGFIARATAAALGRHPIVNASLDGTSIVYRKDVNIGIAVALESGLIVPVIRQAGELSLLGLCRSIQDVADRARARQLKAEEVHGGTFTITNPGGFGAQFGMPIINQPQVAILGVGAIEKRPIVIDDAIAIRTMAYLTLGFDHRLIDGAVADAFMADIKQGLEQFDPAGV